MITDITERKRAEEERERLLARERAARAEAEALAQLRERFMAVLGHDLRQPLSLVSTTAELLAKCPPGAPIERKKIDRLLRGARQMSGMIRDLLDFARSRSGGIPISPRPADLRALCREVVDGIQATHPDRTIRLEAEGDCRGDWDPDRLSQVLGNLVDNAVRHGAAGHPVVLRLEGGEGDVVLEVENSGDPIPSDEIGAIFEPFHRAKGARSPDGLGLGLAIVREIVEAHGGEVSVRSSAEEGTTFTVRLPRRLRAAA
jgi:signal transduction histidine kinase